MPTNLYGTHDNLTSSCFACDDSQFHEAKLNNNAVVTLWGSGNTNERISFCR
jgi:GDP-L-fucose synthase